MYRKRVIIYLLALVLLACKTYELEETPSELVPYHEGQLLLFKSNKGRIDSIRITNIVSQINPKDQLNPLSDNEETLDVLGEEVSNGKSVAGTVRLMSLIATEDGVYFHTDFSKTGARFYGGSKYLHKDSLVSEYVEGLKREVVLLHSLDTMYLTRTDYIKTLYWNKNIGLLGYDLINGNKWRLLEGTL